VTRLFINIFFIVVVCFTLAVLPINTATLEMLDFGDIFSSEDEPIEEEIISVDESFVPSYEVTYHTGNTDRIYNPTSIILTLKTNIPSEYESNYNFNDINITLYQNDEVFQILGADKVIKNSAISYDNDTAVINYELELDYYNLKLNRDGFFDAEISFIDKDIEPYVYPIAYRPDIEYVNNGSAQNNGNFIYKTFFKNEDATHLVPVYMSVTYPEKITVEVRNRLYNPPPIGYGLSTEAVIPQKSSVQKLGPAYYGVFMYSDEINKVIDNDIEANLAVEALIKSLTRLPHIDRLSLYVNDQQLPDTFYNVDLSQVYEQNTATQVYLTEANSTDKRYLMPFEITEANVYDEILSIFNILKTGYIDDKQWTQIIPPEVEMNTFMIEGTTITADFNEAFLIAYENQPNYRRLMINSILYSFTSNPNIIKVVITVNGQPVENYAGYSFLEPQLEPSYINFIGEY